MKIEITETIDNKTFPMSEMEEDSFAIIVKDGYGVRKTNRLVYNPSGSYGNKRYSVVGAGCYVPNYDALHTYIIRKLRPEERIIIKE